MIEPDLVISDGQILTAGDVTIQAFETPGHTMGTVSFAYDARDGGRTYRAFTVGGLGLNVIQGPEHVEAFIASAKRIRAMTEDTGRPIELHLTTHAFSTGPPEHAQAGRSSPTRKLTGSSLAARPAAGWRGKTARARARREGELM